MLFKQYIVTSTLFLMMGAVLGIFFGFAVNEAERWEK